MDCGKDTPVLYWDRNCKLALCSQCMDKHDKEHSV